MPTSSDPGGFGEIEGHVGRFVESVDLAVSMSRLVSRNLSVHHVQKLTSMKIVPF